MSNTGGKFSRSIVSPETMLIDHESRLKILERGSVSVSVVIEGGGVLLWGLGPPVDANGTENDFYIDITAGAFYGPKTDVAWPTSALFLGGGGSGDVSTLMGFTQWSATVGEWTFGGDVILARPDFVGRLIWIGGDASTDDPSAMMATGDLWYPESE